MLTLKNIQNKRMMLNSKWILVLVLCVPTYGFSQVGINTTTPLSTLDINGNLSVKVLTLTGTSSTTFISDGVYLSLNPQATDQEFQLPSPITYPGRIYYLRNINNTNTAKLTTAAGNFFFKPLTTGGVSTIYMYDNHYRTLMVVSDGVNWTVFD
jgi:hypothetical protein